MSVIEDFVAKYWNNESNCSQAVAAGVLDYFKLNGCTKIIHHSLQGFGGGMGERSICGAVTGGLASLGVIMGEKDLDKDEKTEVFNYFKMKFFDKFQTLKCGEILSDFVLPDGSIDKENPERRFRCSTAVETAAKIIEKIVNDL